MTIDEAIKHCLDVARGKCKSVDVGTVEEIYCGEQHLQLAEWLEELKTYRETISSIKLVLNAYRQAFVNIRAEIRDTFGNSNICEWFEDYDYEENSISEYRSIGNIEDIIAIIDDYIIGNNMVEKNLGKEFECPRCKYRGNNFDFVQTAKLI